VQVDVPTLAEETLWVASLVVDPENKWPVRGQPSSVDGGGATRYIKLATVPRSLCRYCDWAQDFTLAIGCESDLPMAGLLSRRCKEVVAPSLLWSKVVIPMN